MALMFAFWLLTATLNCKNPVAGGFHQALIDDIDGVDQQGVAVDVVRVDYTTHLVGQNQPVVANLARRPQSGC